MVFRFSGVTGEGIKELLYEVSALFGSNERLQPVIFQQEYFPEEAHSCRSSLHSCQRGMTFMYVVEGPKIEKNAGIYKIWIQRKRISSFQKFLKDTGILDELEAAGIQEGDSPIKMYGLQF